MRKGQRLPEILTDEEVQNLLGSFNKRYENPHKNYVIILLTLNTGMRVSEISNLRVEDIDLNSGRIHLKQGKGKKDRILYVSPLVLEEVRSYIERIDIGNKGFLFTTRTGNKVDINNLNRMVKNYTNKVGITKHITFHSLRHTLGTKVLKQTGNLRIVQKVLGHSHISTTTLYTHLTDEDVENVMTQELYG